MSALLLASVRTKVADYVGIRPVAACGGSVVILSGLLWFLLRRRAAASA